jgi:hypothetical protein
VVWQVLAAVQPCPAQCAGDPLSGNWAGNTSSYSIVSNQVKVKKGRVGDGPILWNSKEHEGADQEVFVTLTKVDEASDEHGGNASTATVHRSQLALVDPTMLRLAPQAALVLTGKRRKRIITAVRVGCMLESSAGQTKLPDLM